MNRSVLGREGFWNAVFLATTIALLLLNGVGLIYGITIVLPHFLYIPVVIGAYRFPRWGTAAAGCIGGVYLVMVLLITGGSPPLLNEALVRVGLLIVIGWLVALLTRRLGEQEDLYRGLFDHSEGGSLLIVVTGARRVVGEVNWKAASLVGRKRSALRGGPLTAFWDPGEESAFFSRLSRGGAVYETETIFSLPDGAPLIVQVSAASLRGGRVILTFFDITARVHAEQALKTANDKLNFLARISADHLQRTVDEIRATVDEAAAHDGGAGFQAYFGRIRVLAGTISRQLVLTESYKDLGTSPPVWQNVQRALESVHLPVDAGTVRVRFWAKRLEIYADPLLVDVLAHLVRNPFRFAGSVTEILVRYQETGDGLALLVEDDGQGIPTAEKKQIFEYDAGEHAGIGLFICRQILEVTGMTIEETGIEGQGAQFVIHVLPGGYRIEGSGDDAPATRLHGVLDAPGLSVRELSSAEFPIAEAVWVEYHQMTGDPRTDRVFAAFQDGQVVSLARCRRHPDGLEVDGVFTLIVHRSHGYAHAVVSALVEACGRELLFMYAVRDLVGFYGRYGFVPIDEHQLPPTIRERYAWAQGQMEGANVCPMRRDPLG
ncbi:PAS/PAC sensor signal transduction histidine kinase [Methanosphaerula palustris E1-9c]|uniref:PAS/PAC sensor signal transduction histidine kinase n=1 Tax=Methanosphaerula palustris (strain ATCC BAA-1556 / DSM 19958 / E1-9c) TaxID=521011 RepID=B8GEM9_METPE|nr:PAS/PAC sensor signal transduction histidine kinase [Methanosphaerula palustris E1-9c]